MALLIIIRNIMKCYVYFCMIFNIFELVMKQYTHVYEI